MSDTATLAFEIGTEEIPAFDLKRATEQLAELVPAALDAVRIPHGEVAIYTSPRRLIAIVTDVAARTEALEEVFRGPAAKIAFDEAGNPTKAAIGFARGKGLDVDALERRDENGTEYVYAVRQVPSQDVAALLPEVLRGVIDGISWPKSCRWGTTTEMFSRPVRWLVALLGNTVIPVEYAGLVADRETRGHRFLAPGPHTVASADDLVSVVEGAYVVPTQEAREAVIRKGVAAIEVATGFTADLPAKTLTEVINLSEYPTPMVGTFDEEFLKVPEEIIVDAMLMHQRYFPLYDADGKLTNKFIIVSNGDPAHEDTIVDGNERVVAARLYDAKFFYDEDLKMPLDAYVDRLDEVVFQEALGTMRDKTARVVKLSARITSAAGIEAAEMRDIARSAYLAKADLVTSAVIEFTSVQGVMGSYYATAAGEAPRVARAIAEHYRPRFSGDAIPTDIIGQVVALSDKIDTICGLFAVGQAPTGSSDPFALRRAALGVLAILEETGLPISLVETIDGLAHHLPRGRASVRQRRGAPRDHRLLHHPREGGPARRRREGRHHRRRARLRHRGADRARSPRPRPGGRPHREPAGLRRLGHRLCPREQPARDRSGHRLQEGRAHRGGNGARRGRGHRRGATWPPLSPTTATPTPSLPGRPGARPVDEFFDTPWSWTRIRRFARTA